MRRATAKSSALDGMEPRSHRAVSPLRMANKVSIIQSQVIGLWSNVRPPPCSRWAQSDAVRVRRCQPLTREPHRVADNGRVADHERTDARSADFTLPPPRARWHWSKVQYQIMPPVGIHTTRRGTWPRLVPPPRFELPREGDRHETAAFPVPDAHSGGGACAT